MVSLADDLSGGRCAGGAAGAGLRRRSHRVVISVISGLDCAAARLGVAADRSIRTPATCSAPSTSQRGRQAAHHYNQQGWHVIRPGSAASATDRQRVDVVASKRWPTVVVVDDTQFQSGDFLESLREQSDDRTKTVFGTTDPAWERQDTIRVSASASVAALAKEFKTRRNEILPAVRRFDPHVGDRFLETRIETRIDFAAKHASRRSM